MTRPQPLRVAARLAPNERIARILASTRALLAEKGYENILTAEVAARCNISEGTIYRYFDSKRELLTKVAEQWFEELLAENQRVASGRGVYERLRQLIWRSLSIVRREPALTRFVLMDLRSDPSYKGTHIYALNRQFTAFITDLLSEAVASGELSDDVPVRLLRDMIFGCIEHQTWAFIRGAGDFSVDAAADGIAAVIYRGMVAKPMAAEPDGLSDVIGRLEQVAARLESKS
jgi:TetR/AcrR family transcriptional regulator, fatty acid metabolism regulator protein